VNKSPIRVLVVDDYEPWRNHNSNTLLKEHGLEVIGAASNGLEAVKQAQELQPDLILLDIGLPILNGIEAARRIRKISPASKILFVSENRSADIATEALSTGACGYVLKSHAASELLPAVETVLAGKRFVSAGLFGQGSNGPTSDQGAAIAHFHEVAFYAGDSSVVDGYARFIESSLEGGNAVIVVVTESHRASLLPKLEAEGVDVPAAVKQGRFILLDAADTLSRLTVNDMPDPVRCKKLVGDLVMTVAKSMKGEHSWIALCGEIAPTLLSKGNVEGAIKLEQLWEEITRGYGVHTLCGYPSSAFPDFDADPVFQRICAEHTAVHGWGAGGLG
jgi:DNA-binding NarL/FixJ family response regulator